MQKGSALIMALLITAIVATVATVIAVHLRIAIRETQLADNFAQAYRDLQGVQYWGITQLLQNAKLKETKPSIENYPQTMPTAIFHQTQLRGTIEDAQGLFNINALDKPAAQAQFTRLISIVDPNINNTQAAQIAKAVSDWLNASNTDSTYLKNNPPYRTAHQDMVSISELRLVNGISAQLYLALLPYIIALPADDAQINIMTAPQPILRSLGLNINAAQANVLADCRQQHATAANLDDIMQNCIVKTGLQLDPNINLVTTSDYFLIKSYAVTANQHLALFSLIKRDITKKNNTVTYSANIIWQSLNTF